MQATTVIASLLDQIVVQYQTVQRRTLNRIVTLAETVEDRHRRNEHYPHGLTDLLSVLADDLEDHQQKEEAILFPLLRASGVFSADRRLARMYADHADLLVQLDDICTLANGFSTPSDADKDWRRLYALCASFSLALRRRLDLETRVLKARIGGAGLLEIKHTDRSAWIQGTVSYTPADQNIG